MSVEQSQAEAAPGSGHGEEHKPRLPWVELGITLAGCLAIGLLILAVPDLRQAFSAAIQGDHDQVREEIDSLGAWGPVLIVALCVIHTVVFYPAEIVDAAAGFAYGFFPALGLTMLGWTISGVLSWWIGRGVARPLLDRWVGPDRIEPLAARIHRGGVPLLLALRVIPIFPFSIISFAAGAADVPLWRFTWTTFVGYLPLTAVFVYFGTRLEGLSLTDPLVIGIAVGLLAVLAGGHLAMRRIQRRGDDARAGMRKEPL